MPLRAVAVSEALTPNGVPLAPKLVSFLAALSEDGKSDMAETGATAVETVEPNLKIDAVGNEAGVEVKLLLLETSLVEAAVTLGVEMLLTTPVKAELLDEF